MLTAALHSSLDALPPERWDRVAAGAGFYSSSGWLRFFEERSPTYLLVSDGATDLAAAICFLVPATGHVSASTDVSKVALVKDSAESTAALFPCLVCAPPLGFSNRLLIRPDLAPAARQAALALLLSELRKIAERGARTLCFPHLPLADAIELGAVDPSLVAVYAHAEASTLAPKSFDEYLASFGWHRRGNIVREVRAFAAEGLTMETRPLHEVVDRIIPLFVAHEKKYGTHLEPEWVRAQLDIAIKHLGQKSRVFCAMKGTEIIGFSLYFAHEGTYYARLVGFDEAKASKKAAVYFQCLFYEPVRSAAREGIARIHYGIGSPGTKSTHGAGLQPLLFMLSFVKPIDPAAADLTARLRRANEERLLEESQALEKAGTPADFSALHEFLGRNRGRV